MERFRPDMYQKSIFTINYQKLKELQIKCLLFDLDNTLCTYQDSVPSTEVKELFHMLEKDFKIIIFSNSTKKRLSPFKDILNVDTAYSSRKPFKSKYLKIMRIYKLKPEEIACIGDQLMTDIWGANKMGCMSIFVNSIGPNEPPWTKFNRIWEKIILRKFSKRGILEKGKYYD